jgi:hypothetical protein
MNDFYVYAWTRPDTGDVFYVGKGRGNRDVTYKHHNSHFMNIVKKLKRDGVDPIVHRIAENITEQEAFDLERVEISLHGRRVFGGTLVNNTDGGEGSSGVIVGIETRVKLSAARRKRYEDPAEREKTSAQQRKRQEDPLERERHSVVLRKHYEDHPETRAKLSASHRRRYENPLEREKTAAANRRRWSSPTERDKMSSAIRMNGPASNNTSGFKGVSFFKRTSKWVAKIKIDGHSKNLGYFDTPESAAVKYDAAAYAAWGDDCYLNFPKAELAA